MPSVLNNQLKSPRDDEFLIRDVRTTVPVTRAINFRGDDFFFGFLSPRRLLGALLASVEDSPDFSGFSSFLPHLESSALPVPPLVLHVWSGSLSVDTASLTS